MTEGSGGDFGKLLGVGDSIGVGRRTGATAAIIITASTGTVLALCWALFYNCRTHLTFTATLSERTRALWRLSDFFFF